MRIIVCGAESWNVAGGGQAAQRLAVTFSKMGHTVTYLHFSPDSKSDDVEILNADSLGVGWACRLNPGEEGLAICIQPRARTVELISILKSYGYKTMFRVHDDFKGYFGTPWYCQKSERILTELADSGHTVSPNLSSVFKSRYGANYSVIGNGFTNFTERGHSINSDLKNVLFLGWLGNPIIDWEFTTALLETAEKDLPNVRFQFVGTGYPKVSLLKEFFSGSKNAEWHEGVDYELVTNFLQQAHIGFVTMKDSDFSRSADNIKIYEYLSANIPTLVPHFAAFSTFVDNTHIFRYETVEETITQIRNWCDNPPKFEEISESLSKFSWTNRCREILAQVNLGR